MSSDSERPTSGVARQRFFAEWRFRASTDLHAADDALAARGALAALHALDAGDGEEAIARAAQEAVEGRLKPGFLNSADNDFVGYAAYYSEARKGGADSEAAHGIAAAKAAQAKAEAHTRMEAFLARRRQPQQCVQGHAFEGALESPCPTCGSPTRSSVSKVRRDALKGVAWSVPLAAGIPLAAIVVGSIQPIHLPGILAMILALVWLGAVVGLIAALFTLARPVAVARSRIKRAT
jgi:hypothetical protein